jgi:GTPase SAR1 family protein
MPLTKYNICLVGQQDCGKRTIIFDFTGNYGEKVTHKCKFGENSYELCITAFDKTIGNESSIRYNDGILFVFDTTSPESFSYMNNCYNQIKDSTEGRIPTYVLVANKFDLPSEVASTAVSSFIWKDSCKCVEVSGFTGKKVEEAFKELCTQIDAYKEWIRSRQKKPTYGFGFFDSNLNVGDAITESLGSILRPR